MAFWQIPRKVVRCGNQKRLKRKEFNNERRKHYRREISLGPSLNDSQLVTGNSFMTILFRHLRNTLRASLEQKASRATYNGGENSGDGSLTIQYVSIAKSTDLGIAICKANHKLDQQLSRLRSPFVSYVIDAL